MVSFKPGLFCWRLLYHSLGPPRLDVKGSYGISTAGNIDIAIADKQHVMNYPTSVSLFVSTL